MKILGIETSCDETAAAVVEDGRGLLSNVVATQVEMHAKYGGIVPEIASRQHMVTMLPVVEEALARANVDLGELDGVAVTHGPGLAGSLLVGVNSAKGLALAKNLPLIGINHLEGHVYAAWLEGKEPEASPGFPLMCLIASGGHTDLILMEGHGSFRLVGRTRDDAAGEAFDKAARVLELGFPGGPAIQKAALEAAGITERFTRPIVRDSLDFSFSGLKSAMVRRAEEKGLYPKKGDDPLDPKVVAGLASEFQAAIVDAMVDKTLEAAAEYGVNGVVLGGGVAANALLRQEMARRSPVEVVVPRPKLCTDNGAMIAAAAHFRMQDGVRYEWDLDVVPGLALG
ncbi:MAG: tRNA (adenosine(37)-N6)-threonylcarbamoyltransferase complex transferase subunit TsaD [SAR202 cluster bacterium]|nr:tRNA (adenosine(37)-N6)-threonylcarbamoyltransferase complex transferase subunit TsaD [SAR202 cluster bacterium]